MSDDMVGPLDRGLTLLRTMSAPGRHRMRPSDLARATGLARSTVDRAVATLTQVGYLRDADRDVELAPRLMEIGNAYLRCCGIPDALGPVAERLADEFDESVSIAVPDGGGVRFVTQITRRRTMSLAFRIGDLLPAERCAPGALFAAEWTAEQRASWGAGEQVFARLPTITIAESEFDRRVRQAMADGWAADDQLIEPGLIAVALPVRDPSGRTVCAVSVVSHTSRHTIATLTEATLPRLREEVAGMEKALADGLDAPASPAGQPSMDLARTAKREMGAGFLQSLARGLAVLATLGKSRGGLTLSAAAEATGLARATARRALLTLDALGYVEQSGRRFLLRPRALELGYAHLSSLGFGDIVQPHMVRLVEQVHESASMAVLDGADIRYIARVPTYRIMSVDITVGTRFPAYTTSMGRVLLAGLPPADRAHLLSGTALHPLTRHTVTDPETLTRILDEVADHGYAFVDEELEEGLRSLAVPVRDGTGRVVAALNVASHAARGTSESTRVALLPALMAAAAQIEADLHVITERSALRLP
jgi:IclR family pca regulon transcriptional regulator